jgi:hypothetical protein
MYLYTFMSLLLLFRRANLLKNTFFVDFNHRGVVVDIAYVEYYITVPRLSASLEKLAEATYLQHSFAAH